MAKRSDRPRDGTGPKYAVRAVERAISILNAFTYDSKQLSLVELTEKTGLSKPTVFRILSTLEHHRYVSFDPAEGSYRLGSKLLELGGIVLSSLGLRRVARPHLDRLQNQLKVTVLFGTLIDEQLVYIDKRDSEGPIRVVSDVGQRRSPHYGMLGMVLMAFMEEEDVKRILAERPLEAHTRFSLTETGAFLGRLEQVRREGYAVEFDEAIEGVWGVAAPVRDAGGSVVAAAGAALPMAEKSEERIAEVVAEVTACAAGISEGLGYAPA